MLGLGRGWSIVFLVVVVVDLLGFGLGGFFFSLGRCLFLFLAFAFLLGGCLVLDCFVDEVELAGDVRVDGLVVDGLVPAGDVGVCAAPGLVEYVLETAAEDANGEEVG